MGIGQCGAMANDPVQTAQNIAACFSTFTAKVPLSESKWGWRMTFHSGVMSPKAGCIEKRIKLPSSGIATFPDNHVRTLWQQSVVTKLKHCDWQATAPQIIWREG